MSTEAIIALVGALSATATSIIAAIKANEAGKPSAYDEAQDERLGNLEKITELQKRSSLAANKYRLNNILSTVEKALESEKMPKVSDVLVLEDTYSIYREQGGNGEIEKRYNEIKAALIKD